MMGKNGKLTLVARMQRSVIRESHASRIGSYPGFRCATSGLRITIFAAFLALSCNIASADPGDLYLSLGAMAVTGSNQKDDINNKLQAQDLDASVTDYDDWRNGWSVSGFLQLAPKWGVELGYADLGKVGMQIDGVAADVDSFLNSVTDLHPTTANGATLALVGRHSFAQNWAVQVKGGVFFWRSSYDLQGANTTKHVSASGTGEVYGLHVITELTPEIEASLGLQIFTVENQLNKAVGVGVSYRLPVLTEWLK